LVAVFGRDLPAVAERQADARDGLPGKTRSASRTRSPSVPLGSANPFVSLAIAAVKAGLVGTVFMRLFGDNPLNRLAAAAGPIWIFVMFLLPFSDYATP